jgi:signal transduction histidine kinase
MARLSVKRVRTSTLATSDPPTSVRTALEQIFGNLLDSALKYLDPRRPGQIEVSAAEKAAESVMFQVRDNGLGIAEEGMDKVFAPLRRAGPQEGMGVGVRAGVAAPPGRANRLPALVRRRLNLQIHIAQGE